MSRLETGSVCLRVGDRLDGEALWDLLRRFYEAAHAQKLYGAVCEAVDNALVHAYPEGHASDPAPLCQVTVAAGPTETRLTVRDWGVGIRSLRPLHPALDRAPSNGLGRDDGRGLGVGAIARLADDLPDAEVRIASLNGEVRVTAGSRVVVQESEETLQGFLVEVTSGSRRRATADA